MAMGNATKKNLETLQALASSKGPGLVQNALVYLVLILGSVILGLAVVSLSPTRAIIAAVAVVLIWLLVKRIEIPLYFAVFAIVALQETEISPGSLLWIFENYKSPGIPSILEIALALLAVCFLVKYFIQRETIPIPIFRVPLVIFLVLYGVSYYLGVSSDNNDIFIKEDSKKFIFPVLFFLCSVNLLDTPKKIKHLAAFIVLVSTAKMYLGILSYLRGNGFSYGDVNVVFVETADVILVVTLIVALVSVLVYRKITWRTVLFVLLVGAPLAFALVYSNRRNAWLGTLLALVLLFFLTPLRLKPRMAAVVGCAAFAGLAMISVSMAMHAVPSGQDLKRRFQSISDKGDKSNETHFSEWEVTIEALKEKPLFGLGFGGEHPPVPSDETINRHTCHNAFLMLYMKMGFPAVVLFIWCLVRYVKFALKPPGPRDAASPDPLRLGLFSTCAYWLVTLNVAPSWWYYRETCLMALVVALVVQLSLMSRTPQDAHGTPCPVQGDRRIPSNGIGTPNH
jgi:O-antigen ligase